MNTINHFWKRMIGKRRIALWVLPLAMALLAPAAAHAQLSLLFSPSHVSGHVGGLLTMDAELVNLGAHSVSWDSLTTSTDSSLVLSNFSSSFETGTLAGGHTLSGVIFDVTPTHAGIFDGTATLSNGSNALVSGNFQVTSAPVPEFSSVLGMGGLLAVGGIACFLRRKG